MNQYFQNIYEGIFTLLRGLGLTLRHFFDLRRKRNKSQIGDSTYFNARNGTFTVPYPRESMSVPDNGRYQLHNEIEDCIVCDKCAKICPVDCIEIEPIRSPQVYGNTSDGTPMRIYAAKFDIDMSKCCFCGLCTVVCPTECLTMTKEYDFSTANILDHTFSFGKMSEHEILQKKKEFEAYQKEKQGEKPTAQSKAGTELKKPARPIFKPKIMKKK